MINGKEKRQLKKTKTGEGGRTNDGAGGLTREGRVKTEARAMNLTELNASLNRQKGGFDRWAHSRLNAVESIRQIHQVDMKKASEEYEELKENHEK